MISRQSALVTVLMAALAFLVARPAELHAQDAGSTPAQSVPDAGSAAAPSAPAAATSTTQAAPDTGSSTAASAPQAATALTGDQQTAANSALCSAISSQAPNPAAASPSLLSSPSVISAAAATFAGTTNLPLPSATSMLQGYVSQHATDILASCAVSNATGGMKIPGAGSMPSMPSAP